MYSDTTGFALVTGILAGIPDNQSLQMRQQFADAMLSSSWAPHIRARNQGIRLPPPFWHSTLLRYQSERLPAPLREFFVNNRQIIDITLSAPLRLVMADYNWRQVFAV